MRRATASGQPKPDWENVLAQAQQHIALQKLSLQVGSGVPGLFTAARGCDYYLFIYFYLFLLISPYLAPARSGFRV